MVERTKNFGFTKPDANEFYNVGVQNENWDKVDNVIGIPSISAANEEEFDTKLLEIASSLSSPVSKFIHVYSTNESFLMGGRANILITKSIADSLDGGVNASVELYQTTNFGVLKMFKNILKNVVQPLEYLNPPMALGVEYRTTERWMGKPVYRKLFDFGSMPNKTYKTMSYYPTWDEVQPVSAVGILNSGGTHTVLPTVNYSGTSGEISLKVQSNNITISASSDIDMTEKTAYVDVRYVYV